MKSIARILEDDPEDREFIQDGLARHGLFDREHYFLYATSRELLASIDVSTTVVVLDFKLAEGETGVDILLKLRLSRKRDDLFVIMISGRIDDDIFEDFMNSGADFFVRKKGDWTRKLAAGIKHGGAYIVTQLAEKQEKEADKMRLIELFKGIENRIGKL